MKINLQQIVVACLVSLLLLPAHAQRAEAAISAPYYTFTSDSEGKLIKTQTAYTPVSQIGTVNGERLKTPEHVFVDDEDYVYITDSGLNKVLILDPQFRYFKELTSDKFSVLKSTFVTDKSIYVVDGKKNAILVFDKVSHTLLKEIGKPDSPIFTEGYEFSPTHVAVDVRENLYVRSTGSVNGLIMLNQDGEFITFFGANPLQVPLVDRLRSFLLTEVQEEKIKKVFPDVPSNLAIDKKGFIYTVTSSVETNPVKKFNVSGSNYFPDQLVGMLAMESVWVGRQNSVYAVSSDGWIFEYDTNGNLLFVFGGKDFNSSRLGLLNRPVSIASNSADQLILVDQGTKLIQTYNTTEFADAVHGAMSAYQAGDYAKSKELWQYTLKYNSIFDNAHAGLGQAYLREGDAAAAMKEFSDAGDKGGISESFWVKRQDWLSSNLRLVFALILALVVVRYINAFIRRKYGRGLRLAPLVGRIRKVKLLDELFYIFTFLRHPLDGFYAIQYEKRVSWRSSTIIYLLVILLLIVQHDYTSVLFVTKSGYYLYELISIVAVALLWVVANYLICSITDGEGKFSDVYNATAYVLSPIVVVLPLLILLSNGLTLEQAVFYRLPIQALTVWILFLMFFMIKDIHNYEVGETMDVIFRSVFTMLVMGLFLFVLFSIGGQLTGFMKDVTTEVMARW